MPDVDQNNKQRRDQTAELATLNERLQRQIVERHALEQRLLISERHLRESQRLAGIGSWTYDPVSETAVWSDGMYRIYGRASDSFILTLANISACTPPEDGHVIAETMAKVRATLQPTEYTHRFLLPNGSVRRLQGVCNFTRDQDGTVERFIGIARDVTDLHGQQSAMERALEDLRRLKEIVDRSPVMVAIGSLTPSGIAVEYVSDNIRQFGYAAEDVIAGRVRWEANIPPEDRSRVLTEVRQHLTARHRHFAVTHRLVTRTGEIRWVHSDLAATAFQTDGLVARLQCLLTDITEQHEAEARIRDLACLNETIVTAVPAGIAAYNAAGQCVFANPALGHILNASVDQLLRQDIHQIASWRESGMLEHALAALTTGEPQSAAVHVRSTFGREIWLDVSLTRFETGNGPHLLTVCHDITERALADANLHQTELRYRMLADSIPDMMYLVEPDGTVLYANAFSARQFAMTPEQIVGKRQQDLFTPEAAERHCAAIRRVAETGQPFVAEVPDVLDPKHPVWIDTRLIPIRDPAGRVTAVMGLSRDVTERRAMISAMQESEERYRQLFQSMREGCLIYDLIYDGAGNPIDALMTAMNASAEAIFGPLVGRRASEVVPTGKPLFLDIYTALDRGQPPVSIESWIPYIKKHLSNSFFSLRKGRIGTIFTDVTARKTAEEQMARYQQQLRHLAGEMAVAGEQERRRIAVNLHDGLGQTLVLCKMKLESVKAAAESPVKRQLQPVVRLIEEAIRDTRSLTFQLSPPVLHEIGLSAAIEWLAENLGEQHGVTIRVTPKATREPTGMAERVTLFQSVRELLLNTVKHARATVIAVDIRSKREHLEIVVEDDGAGFDPTTLQGLGRKGLGLFNIQERLQLIGGEMKIRSQPGKGTSITLVAPVAAAGQEEEATREHPNRAV